MSKLGQLRKKWNYLQSAHRCINCAHYRKANTFLCNSLPVQTPTMCASGDFITPCEHCDGEGYEWWK
jgi:hypothetical protein